MSRALIANPAPTWSKGSSVCSRFAAAGEGWSVRGGEQDNGAADPATPDAVSHLMELGKTKAVCAPDDHGIGTWDVEPGFYEIGRQ